VLHASDDPRRVVPHPPQSLSGHREGHPRVHYGRIGSGDVSLRDARERDDLAARHEVLAFEMEGAGVGISGFRDGLEWLVVRGISDYGDSATDHTWRRYASLAAAAYTRALLAASPIVAPRGGHAVAASPLVAPRGGTVAGTRSAAPAPRPRRRSPVLLPFRVGALAAAAALAVAGTAATWQLANDSSPDKGAGSGAVESPTGTSVPGDPCRRVPASAADLPPKNEYVLKESDVSDKVDLDTGNPGHGAQVHGPWDAARDGRLADLIVERDEIRTACGTASLLLAYRGGDVTPDGCRTALAEASALTNSIKVIDLAVGDLICATTDEGLVAHIEVTGLQTAYPTTVTIAATVDQP